ncbi:MAG TPA: succinate dehydrogenase assembly factor 2 [Alphaproteobacteria bacterium]|nr:succinate dehydrogenase assembly factor 2 [Alphaproteobacteria bacterium]
MTAHPLGSDSGDAADALAIRRKRLQFRSWHRGTREMDLILGPFADRHLADFDEGRLDRYQALLEEPEPDVYDWIVRGLPLPPEHENDVTALLLAFRREPRGG